MRFWIFIAVLIVALTLPVWCFLISAALYALWRPAYELLCIGVCIDAQFGVVYEGLPYLYTLSAGGIILLADMMKPLLMVYDTT
ncbi:MAG: hypothetical protein LR017_01950 [Candidatus Pacebacteria bacterium]|nr:hypothetical protein [Candidatus Paceibacterota bacterium]